ncbi:AbrB/MazE/SpoVT family DNA-binding domain-containing protein [Alicyclobacillus sendaiensis]|uniref:AbrB/MazE/SpoVT family DNA-binding domain-containing protein n=1 Tax=Alicyclobacillus sendaiensis TaxID=192387 RepID=UPI0035712AA5
MGRLGRMTIPPEVRGAWNLRNGDPMRFTVEGDTIVAECVSPLGAEVPHWSDE